MRYLDYGYDEFFFENFINDAINALPDSVTILPGKLDATLGSRVGGKCINARQNPLNIFVGNAAKIFCDRFFKRDVIFCHAFSSRQVTLHS